jgi:hypothetical protein
MSELTIQIPDSLRERIEKLAAEDAVSLNQFIASAVAEKASAIETGAYLKRRLRRVTREEFEEALSQIPSRPPLPGDELP